MSGDLSNLPLGGWIIAAFFSQGEAPDCLEAWEKPALSPTVPLPIPWWLTDGIISTVQKAAQMGVCLSVGVDSQPVPDMAILWCNSCIHAPVMPKTDTSEKPELNPVRLLASVLLQAAAQIQAAQDSLEMDSAQVPDWLPLSTHSPACCLHFPHSKMPPFCLPHTFPISPRHPLFQDVSNF